MYIYGTITLLKKNIIKPIVYERKINKQNCNLILYFIVVHRQTGEFNWFLNTILHTTSALVGAQIESEFKDHSSVNPSRHEEHEDVIQ